MAVHEPEVRELCDGWEVAGCAPGAASSPEQLDGLCWLAAVVPGTAAAALRATGLWAGEPRDFDAQDWWFRVRFSAEPAAAGEELRLCLDGIATVWEAFLNGRPLAAGESMFLAHEIDVTALLEAENELTIRCAALAPLLHVPRRPRARWRTRLIAERNLRFYRTMLLGRAPGFAPGPAAVGPWKPVRLARARAVAGELALRADAPRGQARVRARGTLRTLPGAPAATAAALLLRGPSGEHRIGLELTPAGDGFAVSGQAALPEAQLWWPHTHGMPHLYEASLVVELGAEEARLDAGRVGFRSLETAGELETHGLPLLINDTPVFARGAVWTPLDLARPCSAPAELQAVLERVVAGGLNMLRVPGTGCYEGRAFHDLCDELGILVWQDFMFANLDYPDADAEFMRAVEGEVRQLLAEVGSRPSLSVLCGGSEVAQQAAMMGLDPAVTGGPLYEGLLPGLIAEAGLDAPYIPSTPWGGDVPFRPNRGVANYYGVGAYLRPLEDARLSEVRFAGECLAFANVPDATALEAFESAGAAVVHHPRWKAGVPRDAAAGWDFDDVRDHYLRLLYGIDPLALRYADPARYLELSRQVTGEVMAEVLGEWRRPGSPCAGALVLWLTDLVPGAGWGVLDHRGQPKVAFHHVARACAPVAVWSTDEGLGGMTVHVANDLPRRLAARLRFTTYQDFERPVEHVEHPLDLPPHSALSIGAEELLGRFVDISWAYRFAPAAQNLIALSLELPGQDPGLISQAFRFPAGRPLLQESAAQLGLQACLAIDGDAGRLTLSSRRFAYGVRVQVPGFAPADDAFSLEPGRARTVALRRASDGAEGAGQITALNLSGRLVIA